MRSGINGTAIVLIVAIVLLFIPCRIALAGNTTVVVSVSIGGGVAVGMVGWFIHLTYSQRVAQAHPPSHGLSGQARTPGEALGLDDLRSTWNRPWNRNDAGFPSVLGTRAAENMPPEQTAFIRFVEIPW
jgi:hypothetical protein